MLPKNEWTKPEEVSSLPARIALPDPELMSCQDVPYLGPIIEAIEAEIKEREDLDSMQIKKPSRS